MQHRKAIFRLFLSISFIIFLQKAGAEESVLSRNLVWQGFIDAQYAYDFNSPELIDRQYTTQPARHSEFNINLAYLAAQLETEKLRGRLTLQMGTSVLSNYLAEPAIGNVSGGDFSRHIQEARIGYKISDSTWLDAGIFFAHVGAETWISKDNITLTRSLVADFSPYYLSGVKLTHQFSECWTGQLIVSNGWQNISENNSDKNVGTGIEYAGSFLTLAYNTLIGREVSPHLLGSPRESEFRHFHDFLIKSKGLEDWEWVAQIDIGFQKKPNQSSFSNWYGSTWMVRYKLNEQQKISMRFETYQDKDQILIVTGQPEAFEALGGSLGFDQTLSAGRLWRTEVRYLKANEDVFVKNQNTLVSNDCTITTSLAMSF